MGFEQDAVIDGFFGGAPFTRSFVDTVLVQEDYSGLDQLFDGDNYINHSAKVRPGFPAVFVQNTERDTLVHLGGADLSVSELQAAIATQT